MLFSNACLQVNVYNAHQEIDNDDDNENDGGEVADGDGDAGDGEGVHLIIGKPWQAVRDATKHREDKRPKPCKIQICNTY